MDPVLDNRSESSPSPNRLRIPPSKLPSDESVVFEKSSFFTQPGAPKTLPSLAEVRTAADLQRTKPSDPNCPPPVRFPSLNLLVKYGLEITIAEGQCLWAIRNCLSNIVPVPEVYGWCRDGREVFIYMQLMRGTTLEERWESLTANEKVKICEQLSRMIGALRQLEQEPGDQFVGE